MSEAAIVHSFRVGRYTVEITLPAAAARGVHSAVCEWSPNVPGRPLNSDEDAQYRAGLAEALRLAAASRNAS